ncbi:MAG: peptidylprolyl isomerase, partial [Planctomycetota bacterium]
MKTLTPILAIVLLVGCTSSDKPATTGPSPTSSVTTQTETTGVKIGKFDQTILENGEASHIEVQHILIGFQGSVPGKPITRSKDEAATLAAELLKKAQGGADFDQLVAENTDDS